MIHGLLTLGRGCSYLRAKYRKSNLCVRLNEKRGFGTVEVVILIAVVVGIALLFRTAIIDFTQSIIDSMFPSEVDAFDNTAL